MRKQATSTGLLVGVLALAATAAAQPSFRAGMGDSIDDGLTDMVVVDLDGDEISDLVFARGLPQSGLTGSVVVLYGFGDGFFDFPQFFDTSNTPRALTVGNFGGDDRLDIATVDSTSSTITVLVATDTRSFDDRIETRPLTCALSGMPCLIDAECGEGQTCVDRGASSPSDIAAADLNGDGALDVAVAGGDSVGQVAILFGNGDGTFNAPIFSPYAAGSTTGAVAIGLLNGDDAPDVIAANRDGASVSVLVNLGDGTFMPSATFAAGQAPVGVDVGDWNEDDNLDVVVANRNSSEFSLLLGDGSGGLAPPRTFTAGSFPSSVDAADLDLDGHLDVLVGNTFSYDVIVAYGDGDGAFALERSFLGGTQPSRVAAALVNQDDRPDIVVLDDVAGANDEYTILMGDAEENGGRSFVAVETVATEANPGALTIGDVNRDARPDIVVTTGSNGGLSLVSPTGTDGVAFASTDLDVGVPANAVLLADLDVDGHAELIYARPAEVPTPTPTGGPVITPSPSSSNDLLAVARSDGRGGFLAPALTTVGRGVSGVDAADFDEDGLLDVAITEGQDDRVAVLMLKPDGTFEAPVRIDLRPLGEPDPILPVAVVAADLDVDGHVDLAVANFREEGLLSLVYGRGDGTFEAPVTLATTRRPGALAVTDVDGDGRPDILALTTGTQEAEPVRLHHASGPRTYDAQVRAFSGVSVPSSITLRDVSGDGLRDMIIGDFGDDSFRIRPGRVQPNWFSAQTNLCPNFPCLPAGRSPKGVGAADFDDNGSYDLVTSNSAGSNLALARSLVEVAVRRGDNNEDELVSAADLVTVMGLLPGRNRAAIEELRRAEEIPTLNLDADGDGLLSTVDSTAVVARIFR